MLRSALENAMDGCEFITSILAEHRRHQATSRESHWSVVGRMREEPPVPVRLPTRRYVPSLSQDAIPVRGDTKPTQTTPALIEPQPEKTDSGPDLDPARKYAIVAGKRSTWRRDDSATTIQVGDTGDCSIVLSLETVVGHITSVTL